MAGVGCKEVQEFLARVREATRMLDAACGEAAENTRGVIRRDLGILVVEVDVPLRRLTVQWDECLDEDEEYEEVE